MRLQGWARWLVCALASVSLVLLVGCSGSADSAIDGSDPEAVLRAYFHAWERGDFSGQESFMAEMYTGMTPEPVKSIEILDMSETEASSGQCTFDVSFDIVVEGEGVSMKTGRHDWSYELTWDPDRESWKITNYGAG